MRTLAGSGATAVTAVTAVLAAVLGIVAVHAPLRAQAAPLTQAEAWTRSTACVAANGGPAAPEGFVVTPLGEILARPGVRIHERSVVTIGVVAEVSLHASLIVRRESDFRSPDDTRILGQMSIQEVPERDTVPPRCATRAFTLRHFAGPQGKVVIAVMTSDKGEVALGRFDFPVARLYNGAFGLGPVRTPISDESYTLYRPHVTALPATDSIVSAVDRGGARMMWIVTYTHYLLGPRDVLADARKGHRNEWWRHVNVTLGVAPAALASNAFVGLSVDFLPFPLTITGGVHVASRTILDPAAGIAAGDTVTGGRALLPLVHRWDRRLFIGASLDFGAVLEVFALAAKTGLGKS